MIELVDLVRIGAVLALAAGTGLLLNQYNGSAAALLFLGLGLTLYAAALENRR